MLLCQTGCLSAPPGKSSLSDRRLLHIMGRKQAWIRPRSLKCYQPAETCCDLRLNNVWAPRTDKYAFAKTQLNTKTWAKVKLKTCTFKSWLILRKQDFSVIYYSRRLKSSDSNVRLSALLVNGQNSVDLCNSPDQRSTSRGIKHSAFVLKQEKPPCAKKPNEAELILTLIHTVRGLTLKKPFMQNVKLAKNVLTLRPSNMKMSLFLRQIWRNVSQ